jgi:hypothetical protein
VAGIQAIHRLLANSARDSGVGLQVFNHCRNLIEILPSLPRSPRNPEDIDPNAEEHTVDALRFGLERRSAPTAASFREIRVGANPFGGSFIDFSGDGMAGDGWGQ